MMVKHIDIELPEQELYCPPLTIRVVDCRYVVRSTSIGTENCPSTLNLSLVKCTSSIKHRIINVRRVQSYIR